MPANLTPEYRAAEASFRGARDPVQRLEWLREMLRVIRKHKGTDRLQGDIKRRTEAPGRPATHDRPFALRRGQTVEDVARLVHKELARSLTCARVWGRSGCDGQHVGREHRLYDGDVVELYT